MDSGPTLSTPYYSIILQQTKKKKILVFSRAGIECSYLHRNCPGLVNVAHVFILLTGILFSFDFLTESTHWSWDLQHFFSCVDAMTLLMERTTISFTFGSKQSPSSSLELDMLVLLFPALSCSRSSSPSDIQRQQTLFVYVKLPFVFYFFLLYNSMYNYVGGL
jgi:hypothetical protein